MIKIIGTTCFMVISLLAVSTTAIAQKSYPIKMTSGPFPISSSAASVEWFLVNNDTVAVDLRITVYRLVSGEGKIEIAPGAITKTMAPGTSTHNANSVGSVFIPGFSHEVVVEATSDKIHPSVEQWSTHAGDSFIPGTLIPSGSFVTIKIQEPVPVMQ